MNNKWKLLVWGYNSALTTPEYFNSLLPKYINNNDGEDDDDEPSYDPSGTHSNESQYGYYRMEDLRSYDKTGDIQIEIGVFSVTRKCVFDLINNLDNSPVTMNDIEEEYNYPDYSLTHNEGDNRPIQLKVTKENGSLLEDKSLAYKYCNALSLYWGLTPYYTDDYNGTPVTNDSSNDAFYGVRLPTNNEWVFAANAGLDNSLYSGPKWTEDDLDSSGTFTNTGSNAVYGEHSQYVDYFRLTYKELDVTTRDNTETDKNGKEIYCWNNIPETVNTITNIISAYNPNSFGSFTQNFEMPFLRQFAWTRYNLYTDNVEQLKNAPVEWLSDMPIVLMSDIYYSGDKDSHSWTTVSASTEDGDQTKADAKIYRVFKVGNNYYKTNIYGWHNRVGNKEGDSFSFGTHSVGLLKPNDYNLYDMTGNISELVQEGWYKGGSTATNQKNITNSSKIDASEKEICGFRVCRTIKQKQQ